MKVYELINALKELPNQEARLFYYWEDQLFEVEKGSVLKAEEHPYLGAVSGDTANGGDIILYAQELV